jgi:hypothetical protein
MVDSACYPGGLVLDMQASCNFGGFGVKNLHLQSLALRVLWQWLFRTDSSRMWQGLPMFKDIEAEEVFHSLVKIQVGNGKSVLFWIDVTAVWQLLTLHCSTICEIAACHHSLEPGSRPW